MDIYDTIQGVKGFFEWMGRVSTGSGMISITVLLLILVALGEGFLYILHKRYPDLFDKKEEVEEE